MSNAQATAGRGRQALPTLLLALLLPALLLASGARAEDPPIATVGPISSSGNTASGEVGSGGNADACVNDQNSTVEPSEPGNLLDINTGSCQAGGTGTAGSTGSAGSSGSVGFRGLAASGASSSGSGGRAGSATWVSSSGALGLKIVRVQPQTKLVGKTRRFAVLVTVRDLRGKTVRHAIVSVGRVPRITNTIAGVHGAISNKAGQAKVSVPTTKAMLGKTVLVKIVARTPKATATTVRSVRLPKAG